MLCIPNVLALAIACRAFTFDVAGLSSTGGVCPGKTHGVKVRATADFQSAQQHSMLHAMSVFSCPPLATDAGTDACVLGGTTRRRCGSGRHPSQEAM